MVTLSQKMPKSRRSSGYGPLSPVRGAYRAGRFATDVALAPAKFAWRNKGKIALAAAAIMAAKAIHDAGGMPTLPNVSMSGYNLRDLQPMANTLVDTGAQIYDYAAPLVRGGSMAAKQVYDVASPHIVALARHGQDMYKAYSPALIAAAQSTGSTAAKLYQQYSPPIIGAGRAVYHSLFGKGAAAHRRSRFRRY